MNVSYLHGLDSLGCEIFGGDAIDIAAKQREMNALNPVTVAAALNLLRGGQDVINAARSHSNLPGGTARDNVYWKLQWHENELKKFADKNAVYPSGADLKRWVMQAFIEANAVGEGTATMSRAWDQMWVDMGHNAAELGQSTLTTAKWTVAVTVGLVGLVGYAAYKILMGPVGQQAVGAYVGTKLGNR